MKNTARKGLANNAKKSAAMKTFMNFTSLKQISRRLLSAFFIYALVFLPLVSMDGAVQKAQAQIIFNCSNTPDAQFIFQRCPLNGTVEYALTQQAIDDVTALYELPASDRPLLMQHARNEIRAMLYVRLLQLINKQNPTAQEQQAIDAFTQRIKEKRIEAAQKAKDEYTRFSMTNCRVYHPPSPYTYNPGYACYSNFAGSFSSPNVPSFEEFQNFGAVLAYGDLTTPEAQTVSTQTTQGIVAGAGIAAAGIGAAAAAAIGSTITFGTLAAVVPFAGITFTTVSAVTAGGTITVATLPAAGAASGAIGASAAAGPAAIIILAVAAAVMQGITVANQSQLPGKLDQAITDKQNETIDIRALINGDDSQKQEVYGAFLRITLPEFPDNETIMPSANDPIFTYSTPTTAAADSNSLTYTPWTGTSTTENNEARLSGRSWFLVHNGGTNSPYRMRLSINYQGENGELLTARRRGREFVITRPENPAATVITDTLKVKFSNTVYSYKVKPSNPLAAAGYSKVKIGCGFQYPDDQTGGTYYNVRLGRIFDTGGTPANQLLLSVNGGAAATVGDITLKNLAVTQTDGVNYIDGRAVIANDAFGESADFNIKVENNAGDTQTFLTTLNRTAIIDTLPPNLPVALNVGTNYTFELSTNRNNVFFDECDGYSYSVTGEIPSGLSFVNNHAAGGREPSNSDVRLTGTAASDGDYQFTINKNYANGEVLSRTFRIIVRGSIAEIPGGVKSWWRAENNAEDFNGRANGMMFGSATFINGKVSRGFYFRGTNGYVQLPDNAFQIASSSQTFETWFKTGANGVILGRQNSNITPYGAAQNLSRPLIYVDRSGKLHSTFGSAEVVSPNAVNNNAYHHVAVTFSEAGGAVYLDGVSIGANNGRAYTGANQKFQFGTGFVNPGAAGELNGWSNFTGTIDEAAIYDQILSPVQIKAIYAAGAGGKISVTATATPPTQRDGSDGTITINAQGGVRQLRYSVNNGATFQTTNFFGDLTPGTYQTVVRDGGDRDVRRTVVINNPAPNLSFTTQVTPPQCFGGNARILIFPSGGSGNYEYSVRNGANVQTSNDFTDIGAGTYTPWLRDVNSSTTFTNGTINITQPTQITVSPTSFANAALNQPYSQTFTVSGGTSGYSIGVSGDVQTNFQLPAGLTSTVSGSTVTISGTPTQTGNFNMFFEIYDQNSCRQGIFVPFVITSNQTYNISGRATNGGQGLANVTINLAGAENRTTTTNAAGNYSFATVAGGANYTVTATLNDATFAQPTVNLTNLSANLTNTDFALSPTTYEGDFAPRRSGDGAVNVLDLVALGRTLMPNNPDPMPANGSEFQRADSNPPNNLGNGTIDQNDVTQIRNYILGTPKIPSGGAIAPASPAANQRAAVDESLLETPEFDLQNLKVDLRTTDAAAADPATVSAGTVTYSGSGDAVVPIRLTTNGGVQAAQFTLNFDANKLSVASIINQAPANTTIVMSNFANGKITVVVNQPIDGNSVFPTGTFDLLRINFTPRTGSVGFARVDFGDAPTQLIAADPQANAVTLNSSPGGVSLNAGPSISGRIANGGQGLSNATVSRTSGGQTITTTTDASGNYYFDNLANGGNYTIRPELNGYTFTPATQTFNSLNASVTNADFNTSQTSYEGDIAGRPTGDGTVNVQDLVSLGRIIGNLDAQPANGAEWQRTDVAPSVSRGDGFVNVQDLVQLGRYAGSLDALVPASGATASAQPPSIADKEERLSDESAAENIFGTESNEKTPETNAANLSTTAANLNIGTATVSSTNALVPIQLNSNSDTEAIQFTVNYDPAKLSIPNAAAITNRYPNTTFVINNNTPGKLGIVAYQPLDGASVFPTGNVKLFDINFTVAGGAGGTTSITFTGDPVPIIASNPQSGTVQTSSSPGTVTLLTPTAAGVSISGRILTPNGRGLANAIVSMTNSLGETRTARTNSFGYYSFKEVAAGETFVFQVISKRYQFVPQVVGVKEELTDLNFTASSF